MTITFISISTGIFLLLVFAMTSTGWKAIIWRTIFTALTLYGIVLIGIHFGYIIQV